MGRKHERSKSSNPELEAEKQREEIRNHILKVFRARISNPCGGGALLVGKDTKVSPSTSEYLSIASHAHNDSSSSSSMNDSDDSLRKASQAHTRTKRKRRCKRRTKRSKVTSKTQGEKSAVTRHLRAAHDVREVLHLKESVNKEQDKISLITLNRLTNKVGLFNKGRKSETISRDIQVSDSVKKKTEDDLKNILNYSDENGSFIALDIEPPSSCKIDNIDPRRDEAVPSGASGKQTQLRHISEQTYMRPSILSSGDQSRNGAKARMSITPVSEPNNKQVNSAGSCKSASSGGLEENLPESPPYEEMAVQLMCTIKPSLVFPGRSILEETREELQKLMRQSAPRSATPTPNLLTLGSTCTGSVKRSLLERFLPEENKGSSKVVGYPNNAEKSEKVTCMETEPNLCNIPKQTDNTSSDIVTDAHVLLRCNDLAITQSKHQYSPDKQKLQNFNPDARKILRHNDSERAKKFIIIPQPRQGEQGSYSVHMIRPPSAFRTKERDALQHQPCIHHDVSSMDTSEYVSRESSHQDSQSSRQSLTSSQASSCGHPDRRTRTYSQVVSTNKAVVAELRHYPEHLLNTTYYSDSLEVLMPQERQHQTKLPMDFLDMMDDTQTLATSPVPVNVLKSATPDSDGSPLWLPVPPPFLKKPTFDTPSPPDKLYPRHLY